MASTDAKVHGSIAGGAGGGERLPEEGDERKRDRGVFWSFSKKKGQKIVRKFQFLPKND